MSRKFFFQPNETKINDFDEGILIIEQFLTHLSRRPSSVVRRSGRGRGPYKVTVSSNSSKRMFGF